MPVPEATMGSLGGLYGDILLGRRGPRDLPPAAGWLLAAVVAYLAVGVLGASVALDPRRALYLSLADVGLTVVVFALALAVRGRLQRLVQTLHAVFGVGVIVGLPMAVLGFAAVIWRSLAMPLDGLMVALEAWAILVVAWIARDALDVPLFNGLAVSTSYFALEFLLVAGFGPH
jgi:hypothetical protein